MTAGRIARKLFLVDESGVFSVDIILPWLSMLIYFLGNEQ
jgi:hypothetical protein